MTHYQLPDILNAIIIGDVQKVLKKIPSESVRCIVTSPPYYGLRDYGTATWLGGDEGCDHKTTAAQPVNSLHIKSKKETTALKVSRDNFTCTKCGAIRIDDQIGLEKTPELYIEKMVLIFRECRRILTNDGTLWLNVGDSYWGSGGNSGHNEQTKNMSRATVKYGATSGYNLWKKHHELKPKDLIGIPWMLAFALRADGWYLRSDIIWNKPNPMPESVQDRPTKAHEYIFLLSKSPKYYYDAEAIKQPIKESSIERYSQDVENQAGSTRANGGIRADRPFKAVRKSGNLMRKDSSQRGVPEGTGKNQAASVPWEGSTANKKSVWTVSTKPFKAAHFATFPEDLIVDCIRAGTSEHGQCGTCGKPWQRVIKKDNVKNTGDTEKIIIPSGDPDYDPDSDENFYEVKTYIPDIPLDQHPVQPDVCMDIFSGAGTTPLVSKKLQRDFIAIELNSKYVKDIAIPRLQGELGMFYIKKIITL